METEDTAIPEWTPGDRLRKAREHARLSQAELAARTGISLSSVSRYETGTTRPSRPVVLAWSLCTGVELEWLLGGGEIIVRCSSRPPRPAPAPRASLGLAA